MKNGGRGWELAGGTSPPLSSGRQIILRLIIRALHAWSGLYPDSWARIAVSLSSFLPATPLKVSMAAARRSDCPSVSRAFIAPRDVHESIARERPLMKRAVRSYSNPTSHPNRLLSNWKDSLDWLNRRARKFTSRWYCSMDSLLL